RLASFKVEFPNHTLLDADTVEWINSLQEQGLTDNHCIALALLKSGEALTNPRYSAATGADSRVATSELRNLVSRELALQQGGRHSSRYRIHPDLVRSTESVLGSEAPHPANRKDPTEEIL